MEVVSPGMIFEQVARSVPDEYRGNIVIIGSLAAGYHFFGSGKELQIRTKDIDCVLSPRVEAVDAGRAIAQKLLDIGWTHRTEGDHGEPGNSSTPDHELPVIRLYPPDTRDWFIEFLTVPGSREDGRAEWVRLELSTGHYGLCSFQFLSLAAFHPVSVESGLKYARPSMMALANMLEHPDIGIGEMSSLFEGRAIKRSNKDLGRVLAIAFLGGDEEVEKWPAEWEEALRACFPDHMTGLAARAGAGIAALLESDEDLEQAMHTCNTGLLASRPVTTDELRIIGRRLQQDSIEPLLERIKNEGAKS